MDEEWTEYKLKSGQIMFAYNKLTGEHRWSGIDENESVTCKEVHSVAIQTDDFGCDNGCSSIYIDRNSSKDAENHEVLGSSNGSIEVKQELVENPFPENNLECRVGQEENSGIYEVLLMDNLQELHLEYPCENPTDGTYNSNEDAEIHVNKFIQSNSSDPTRKAFQCSYMYCPMNFDSASKLADHVRTHTGEKPFECLYCDKRFAKKCNQQRHLKRHTGELNFKCSFCDKKFVDSGELQRHVLSHNREKGFECPSCKKKFTRKDNFNAHMRDHCGNEGRTFICTYCDAQFLHRTHLKCHIRVHTGGQPIQCTYCHRKFENQSALQRHVRIHTGEKPFECMYCDKKFAKKFNQQRHVKSHTGEKNHKCTVCEKKFIDTGALQRHMVSHTGKRDFECHGCDKKFVRKRSLIRHVKKYHYTSQREALSPTEVPSHLLEY